jgi:hypothetical protein
LLEPVGDGRPRGMIAEPRKGGTEPGLSAGFPFDFCPFFAVDRNRSAPLLLPLARGGREGGLLGFYPFRWAAGVIGGRFRAWRAGVLSFVCPKESSQRKGHPWVGAGCAGSMRYSGLAGAAQFGLRPQAVLALYPLAPALLGLSASILACCGRQQKRSEN